MYHSSTIYFSRKTQMNFHTEDEEEVVVLKEEEVATVALLFIL